MCIYVLCIERLAAVYIDVGFRTHICLHIGLTLHLSFFLLTLVKELLELAGNAAKLSIKVEGDLSSGRYLHISCHSLTENVAVEERKLEDPGNEASQQECDQSAPVEELEEKSERNEHEKNGHDAKENDLEHRLCRLAE